MADKKFTVRAKFAVVRDYAEVKLFSSESEAREYASEMNDTYEYGIAKGKKDGEYEARQKLEQEQELESLRKNATAVA